MTTGLIKLDELIWGPMLSKTGKLPLVFQAIVGDLGSRMIAKGRVGLGYRAVARNGRILLASNRAMPDLAGREAHVRIQTWKRIILSGEAPELYGLVLCLRYREPQSSASRRASALQLEEGPLYRMQLMPGGDEGYDLALDVGGGLILAVHKTQ